MRKRLQEATEYDIILSVMNELTHNYVDGRETPSYFVIDEITDNYGLSSSEVIDIAENNGYNIYRIPGGDNLVDKIVIAHEDLSYGDIVKEDTTKVDIEELGKETKNSFNMEEDYMEDVKPFTQRQIFDELKRETDNFTKEDIFKYYFFEEQQMAVKILEKHYDDVDYWSDDDRFAIDHTAYFVQFREPKKGKKQVKENKLDDLKVSSYRYLLDVYDKDGNFIERKFFRSRPEADRFVDAIEDLFDIKIFNNEVVELKDGKDFFGTYWKVIRDLKKEESFDDNVMFHGSDIVGGKLEKPKYDWTKLPKRKKYKGYYLVNDAPYWDVYDAQGNRLNKEIITSFKRAKAIVNNLNSNESIKEEKESQVYRDYKIVLHPGYNMWINMRDYYQIYNPHGIKVGSVKTLDAAKELIDKRIANKEDEYKVYEDVNHPLVGKKVNFKGEECTIEDVEDEEDEVILKLSNGKQVSAKVCVEKGFITSEDEEVNALLNRFKVEEPEEIETTDDEVEDDPFNNVEQQAIRDANKDWEEYKPNLSPMYLKIKKAKGNYAGIPTAKPEVYADIYKREYDRLRGKNRVEDSLNRYNGIIERTYPGDVDELISWLRRAATNIWVSCGEDVLKSTQKKVDWFNERDNTNANISTQKNKLWSSWVADLTQKEEILKDMPKEVLEWKVDKNSGISIDDWENGLVYNKQNNRLASNPVVIDLLKEYDFKLGSQTKKEELEEDTNDEVVEETNEYKIVKTIQHNFKTVNGVAKKGKDKVIYQVYFRTQDFNPATNRWMNKGWANSTSDFNSIEDARAYVKKYGKELKESKATKYIIRNENRGTPGYGYDDGRQYDSEEEAWDVVESKCYNQEEEYGDVEDYDVVAIEIEESLEEDIEKHDTLNPKLFDGEELKPEIKDKIEQIAYQFIRELNEDGIRFTLKDIVLLGSNVSYNYTKDSDLDIHLIADSSGLECPDDLYPLIYSAYRSMFNKNYDIRIKGIPSEIYVEMDEPQAKSNGIYSLNNGWLKKPEQRDIPDLDEEAFDKLFNEWEDKYFDLIESDATSEDIENFIEDIYNLRKEGIANEGEYALGNLVFKEFRNMGYLDNLKELRRQGVSKELSLEHLDEEMSDDELFDKVMKMLKNDEVDDEQLFRISDESVYTLDEIKQDIIDNPARVVRALIEEEVFTKEMFESLDEGIFDKIHDKKFGTHTLSKKESGGTVVVGLEVGSDKFSKEEQEEFTKDNLEHYREKIQKVLRDNNIDGATISAIHDGEWKGNWEHSVDVSLLYIKEKDLVKVAKELRTSFKQDVVLVRLNKNNKIYSIDN